MNSVLPAFVAVLAWFPVSTVYSSDITQPGTLSIELLEQLPSNSVALEEAPTSTELHELQLKPSVSVIGSGVANVTLNNTRITPNGHNEKVSYRFVAKSDTLVGVKIYHKYDLVRPGYHSGDGGLIRYTIQEDDNSKGSYPSGKVLARVGDIIAATDLHSSRAAAEKKYPGAIWSHYGETGTSLNSFRRFDFDSPARLTPGKVYHLVLENTSPDKSNWISVDNLRNSCGSGRHNVFWDNVPEFAPAVLNMSIAAYKDNAWYERTCGQLAIYEHYYADGTIDGQTYIAAQNVDDGDGDRTVAITGGVRVRQVWTPSESGKISEISIFAARTKGNGDLWVRVSQAGAILLEKTLSASQFPLVQFDNSAKATVQMEAFVKQSRWNTIGADDVAFVANEQISVEFYTTDGSEYEMPSPRDGTSLNYFSGSELGIGMSNGHAEISTNDGATWGGFNFGGGAPRMNNDLSFVAVIHHGR